MNLFEKGLIFGILDAYLLGGSFFDNLIAVRWGYDFAMTFGLNQSEQNNVAVRFRDRNDIGENGKNKFIV